MIELLCVLTNLEDYDNDIIMQYINDYFNMHFFPNALLTLLSLLCSGNIFAGLEINLGGAKKTAPKTDEVMDTTVSDSADQRSKGKRIKKGRIKQRHQDLMKSRLFFMMSDGDVNINIF